MRGSSPGRRKPTPAAVASRVLSRLRDQGYLLFSDPRLESVVGIVVGAPVRGSWWGHPMGGRIYEVSEILEGSSDVLELPLFFQKSTLVHRRNWSTVLTVVAARARWQLDDLSLAARTLLAQVDQDGEIVMDQARALALPLHRTMGEIARELEKRLLVLGRSVHTPGGRHAKVLTSWRRWSSEREIGRPTTGYPRARAEIEERIGILYPTVPLHRVVPWRRYAANAFASRGGPGRAARPQR
jgi:hypothetical protein